VRAGIETTVEILIDAAEIPKRAEQVVVTSKAFEVPQEINSSHYLISAQVVRDSAESLKDVSRYVQTLPGVTFGGNDFRNDIVVRGGSPLENLFLVDNVEIPNINHFANFASAGGPVGMLNGELLEDVTFLTGGYPAPYPNRLSSVLQITQREGARDRTHVQGTLGFSGVGAVVEGPLTRKGSYLLSLRRSFLDAFTKDIGIGGVPVYYNETGKVLFDPTPSDRIWIVGLAGRDKIRIRPDPSNSNEQADLTKVDYLGWRTASGLNWQHLFGTNGVGLLGITCLASRSPRPQRTNPSQEHRR